MLQLHFLLLVMRFHVAGVSLSLSLKPPNEGDCVVAIEDTTDLFQRQRSIGTFRFNDGEV